MVSKNELKKLQKLRDKEAKAADKKQKKEEEKKTKGEKEEIKGGFVKEELDPTQYTENRK